MIDPRTYAATESLKDGTAVTVRALRADDRERMARAVRGLERESIYFRLFSYRNELTEAGLDRIMRFDPDREVALVATIGTGADETIVGAGRYVVDDAQATPRAAEIAFMVEEDYQGRGLASRLLRHLVHVARGRNVALFTAEVLAENTGMLRVFERSGLPMTTRRELGVVHVALALGAPP
jgi:GNAT superfamily N-acetyltransferase